MTKEESAEIGQKRYVELMKAVWLIVLPLLIIYLNLGAVAYLFAIIIYTLIITSYLHSYSYNKYIKKIRKYANRAVGYASRSTIFADKTLEERIEIEVNYLVNLNESAQYVMHDINKYSYRLLSSEEAKELIVEEAMKILQEQEQPVKTWLVKKFTTFSV